MPVELHETDIDGVRCYWVDAKRPTLSAQLTFRQGMADEPLNESGWLHLLEHLCLEGRGGGALHVNGSVSVLTTELSAHGPVDAVLGHLSDVSGWLACPDLHDLDREREVLRAEARLRGGPAARALGWRYGAQGPGLASYDDPGLGRVGVDALRERAARVFTRGNAVLALDGPPPAGLRLRLPAGPILPAKDAVACDNGMAAYIDEAGLVISGVVARSEHATVVPNILQRALRQRLRDHAGGSYAPWADYHRVDTRNAVVLAGSDVTPALLPRLAELVMDLVTRFTSDQVPPGWMQEIIAERLQAYTDPHLAAMVAWRAASMSLVGDRPEGHTEMLEQTRMLDPEAVRADLLALCDSLLLGIPGHTAWNDQLPMLTFPVSTGPTRGKSWRHREWPLNDAKLSVDESRVTVSHGKQIQTVALTDVAGMFCFADGARHLVSEEGWALTVEPDRWRGGSAAIQALDRVVPTTLHLPHPARDNITPFRPSPWPRRWWHFLASNRAVHALAIVVTIVALMIGIVVISSSPDASASGDADNGRSGLAIGVVLLVIALVAMYRPSE